MFDPDHYSFRQDHEMMVRTTFSASNQSISGTSGANIQQLPGVNVLNQQPLYVSDLFSQGTTSGDIVRFIIEDTFTNAATRVAEGSAKPEATLDVSIANATVEKTATWLKVTEEMLEDFEQMQSFINGRLAYMVQALEDTQLLTGSGSSQIKGVLNWSGIQNVSGAIGTIDSLCKAVDYVRGANGVGFANPTAIIMHPLDWLNVRLSKDSNGQYLLGGPTFGSYGVGGYSNVAMAWGLPVVATTSITRGTALTGDFRMGAQIFRRKGLTLATTNSDNNDFQLNLITIRAEQRMTLAVYQPNRFCSITGIPA
jgi:HK97 family phage major capsid protein